jgi:hypothetical protein
MAHPHRNHVRHQLSPPFWTRNCRHPLWQRLGTLDWLRHCRCRNADRRNWQLLVSCYYERLGIQRRPNKTMISAFRYLFQKTSDDAEKGSWGYACLAKTVREGGFKVAVMARLSAIPGHCKFGDHSPSGTFSTLYQLPRPYLLPAA